MFDTECVTGCSGGASFCAPVQQIVGRCRELYFGAQDFFWLANER
jgi:hypothetical protein